MPTLKDAIDQGERAVTSMGALAMLSDHLRQPRVRADVTVRDKNGKILSQSFGENLKTTAGIDFLLSQGYSAGAGVANGLCYVACSTDTTITETSASTMMANEITTLGLARHIGTYAHTAGASTCTVSYQFTATGSVTVGKVCLYTASSGGTVNHILLLATPQPLIATNTFTVTFTITLT